MYEREKQKRNHNQATLAGARKLVAYLVAVDRREQGFHKTAPKIVDKQAA